jgi:predicted small integral membrane protein
VFVCPAAVVLVKPLIPVGSYVVIKMANSVYAAFLSSFIMMLLTGMMAWNYQMSGGCMK